MSERRRMVDAALVVLFVAFLCAPTVRNLSGSQPAARHEFRAPAPRPEWKWRSAVLQHFPTHFEAYYNDHFGYRHKFIDLLNNFRVRWLNHSSSPHVCLGKNGWLYFEFEPLGNDYTTHRAFTEAELVRWKLILEGRRDWLRELGIPYVFVIAPDKQSVYPEMLPRDLQRRWRDTSRLEQLLTYLRANSDVDVVDLRPPLRDAKAQSPVFFLTDSHWNDHGAYAAYVDILKEVSRHFPQVQPAPRSDFIETTVRRPGGDLARMMGLPNRMSEEHYLLVPCVPRLAQSIDAGVRESHRSPQMQASLTVRPGTKLPRAVLFHDSFAKCVMPLLAEHFQRMSCRWLEPHEFDADVILRERPDVVIQQIVERKLNLPFPPDCLAGLGEDFGHYTVRAAAQAAPQVP